MIRMLKKSPVTQERLKELYRYDPLSGVFTWAVSGVRRKLGQPVGWKTEQGYMRMEVDGVAYFVHTLAFLWMTGHLPSMLVDHKNGCRTDNRFTNLRLCNDEENTRNHRIRNDNRSGYMGVYHHTVNKSWCAHIRAGGKLQYLGSFKTAEEAARARDAAARLLHGEFAALNFHC